MTQKRANSNGSVLARKKETPYLAPSEDKNKVFITTTDEVVKDCLIDAGFRFLAQSGNKYFFPYDEEKVKKCLGFEQWEDIAYTDVLTF